MYQFKSLNQIIMKGNVLALPLELLIVDNIEISEYGKISNRMKLRLNTIKQC